MTYFWVLESADGPVAQTPEQAFTWIDESFDWERHDSADVSVYTYDDDADFDQYILQSAQEAADKYKLEYDIAEIEPMRIWVYASGRDFATTLRQNSETWVGGFSLPEAGVIAVPIEPGDDYSVERVIVHEVSHHVLYQATNNPFSYPPTWFDEGLAVVGQLAGNDHDLEIVLGAYQRERCQRCGHSRRVSQPTRPRQIDPTPPVTLQRNTSSTRGDKMPLRD